MTLLSSDSPLQDPNADAFGYRPFARHVARALIEMAPTEGFAVAVHGPWGSGKSTLLNFVQQSLDELPQNKRPVVVVFNPWWFSGSDDLVGHFFRELLARLNAKDERTTALRKHVARFGDVASAVDVSGFSLFKILKLFSPDLASVHKLRGNLEKCLRDSGQRIVVVVDDVDRLTSEEIRQLFRVVRAVVNLPNITYLLAYDAERVAESLGGGDAASGFAYLEKIVQLPFDLPIPGRSALSAFFTSRLQTLFSDIPEEAFDHVRWANVYADGIERFLSSPRSAIRLVNALALTLPAVQDEVDVIDFVALESLRLYAPRVYDAIRQSPRLFAGSADRRDRDAANREKAEVEVVLGAVPQRRRDPVKVVLLSLFPRLHSILANTHFGSDHESRWRRDKRAASLDHLEIYFRLTVPDGSFSSAEMRRAIAAMATPAEFATYVGSLTSTQHSPGVSRAREFLNRIEDYTAEGVPADSVVSGISGLLSIGDDLVRAEPDREQIFDFGMGVQIARVLLQLMRRVPAGDRVRILEELSSSAAVSTLVDLCETLVAQHDPSRDELLRLEPLVSDSEVTAVKAIALKRIHVASRSGELEAAPRLPSLLRRWADWSSESEMREWLAPRLDDHAFFCSFMAHFVQTSLSWGLSDRAARKSRGVDLKWLGRFIDPAEAKLRAAKALELATDPKSREALRLIHDTVLGLVPQHGDR